ncbi:MAG TPA: carbon-nitrogen hydrolase family protein [Anaerolineales bacterium]|nr:carbon-nitrogen hydrolase family protein [Anaerolineales bacterium]
MREVTIACVQMKPILYEVESNLVKMGEYIATICSQQKVDFIVFPELATTGYECGVRFTDLAQRVPGSAVNVLAQRAAEYGVYIAFGMAAKEKVESVLYSAVVLIGPDGEYIGHYRKVHLKGEERMTFRRGLGFPVFETNFGQVGLLTGYDLAFPEAARSLALDGAELLLVSANWEKGSEEELQIYTQARAAENGCFVAVANRVGEDATVTFCGCSALVGSRGQIFATMAGELNPENNEPAEGYAISRLDLSDVRRTREELHTFQNRAPDAYKSLARKY